MAEPTILERIVARKRREVAAARAARPAARLEAALEAADPPRGFAAAMARRIAARRPAVIAEIKRASPSKGPIRAELDPAACARSLADAGAACLSVLTDREGFRGSDEDLLAARAACSLPVLRKDFIVDEYQLVQSRLLGADCVLLIVAALDRSRLAALARRAGGLGMDVLAEAHDAAELELALETGAALIGINNRNLHTFDVSLEVTLGLVERVPEDRLLVTESGIGGPGDVRRMLERGVYGFLAGEVLMRAPEPGARLRELFFAPAAG